MTIIHDGDGNEVADIGLSDKQRAVLETGEDIVVIYHTPQLLRYLLGEQSGSFSLHMRAPAKNDKHIITPNSDAVKHFAKLQKAIKAAREKPNAKNPG